MVAPRTPARGPTPQPHHPRPYNDYGIWLLDVIMVRAGVDEWMSGAPCGRPADTIASHKLSSVTVGTFTVALGLFTLLVFERL